MIPLKSVRRIDFVVDHSVSSMFDLVRGLRQSSSQSTPSILNGMSARI